MPYLKMIDQVRDVSILLSCPADRHNSVSARLQAEDYGPLGLLSPYADKVLALHCRWTHQCFSLYSEQAPTIPNISDNSIWELTIPIDYARLPE